ncbi:MAG: 3-oxoacyl-[acyl-carrier-protein] reductase [Rhodobacteraceae bacterium]|nr:3-oxoacyl-[acyl-carrier-protein] reductase [Paracoccaceae bacterium]
MFDLTGKRALVTGASGDIGGAIATSLHARGATVALSGTRIGPLEDLAATLGGNACVMPANLGDADAVTALPGQASEAMGGLDILINNAGVTRDTLLMRMSDEEWQTVIDINLTSAMRLMRAVVRPMMKNRWGRIINIASVVSVTGNAGQVNYAASKAGMIGMTKSCAQEVAGRGITANCVAPGLIETAMTATLPKTVKQQTLSAIPAGRMGSGRDIASAVVFLSSEEAGYITGQTLHVNGGMAMI